MLHHVGLEVPPGELDRAVEFWQLVGFTEVSPPASVDGETRWLEREGTQIHLLGATPSDSPGLWHPAVVVEDFGEVVAALVQAGFEVDERRRHWGADRAFVTTPGGHRAEIMAAPPPRQV